MVTTSNSLSSTSPGARLRATMSAVRVSFTWMGVRKTLSPDQRAQAAEPFGAEQGFLSAAKKLLDTSDPLFRAVTGVRSRIVSYWRGMTLPYPEPGLRLIRQDQIEAFDRQLAGLKEELDAAVLRLDAHFDELKSAARVRLGDLYAEGDYPSGLVGLFGVEATYPAVEPPEYLLRLSPRLYEAERQRIAARFDEAVQLAESAFVAEFGKLVTHLTERLHDGGPEGERKVFRDSAVENLQAFFARFRNLSVHSNAQLDELVEAARRAVQGVSAQDLRNSDALRRHVAGQMATVTASLDGLLVESPRRRLLRTSPHVAEVA